MFGADLATPCGVEARVPLQAVKRNSIRFPADFMFSLSSAETKKREIGFLVEERAARYGNR